MGDKMRIRHTLLFVTVLLCVSALFGCSSEPTFKTEADERMFNAISKSGDLDEVKASVSDGACIDKIGCGRFVVVNAVELAVENGHDDIAEWLIKNGADANYKTSIMGESLLMFMAEAGKPELVRLLLDSGADITAKDRLGDTPLEYACRAADDSDAEATAKILMSAGAKATAQTLSAAKDSTCNYRTTRLVTLALEETGEAPPLSPAVMAAIKGDTAAVRRYSSAGELKGAELSDVLFFTAALGKSDTLALFSDDALAVTDDDGKTLLEVAERYGNADCAEYLSLHAPAVSAGAFGSCGCNCCCTRQTQAS